MEILKLIPKCETLTHLDLSDNELKEKFACVAFQQVAQNRNFLSLKLQGNYISLKRIRDIEEILEKNKDHKRKVNIPKYEEELIKLEAFNKIYENTENMFSRLKKEYETEKELFYNQEEKLDKLKVKDATEEKVAQEKKNALKKEDIKLHKELEQTNVEYNEEKDKYDKTVQKTVLKIGLIMKVIQRLQSECKYRCLPFS